ncbi:MAG: hypothetical protein ACLFVW_07380 [Phycisphaerae bacterium]
MRFQTAIATAVCGFVLVLCGGCSAIGWTVALFAPPEKEPAVYKPPKGKTYLVFVDDIASPVEYEGVKGELTEQLNQRLERHRIASRTVDYSDVVKLVSASPDFNQLPISEVGRKLGAEMVLYVQIDRFELSEYANTSTWNGVLEASARVVDADKRKRLWPEDRPSGYPVDPVRIPQVELESRDQVSRMAKMLAVQCAEKTIKLFIEHPKPSLADDDSAFRDW